MFKTHLALGFFIAAIITIVFKIENPAWFIVVAMAASALPDLDSHKSKLGRKVLPLSWFLETVFGHRGFVHSLFPPLLAFIGLSYFGYEYLGGAVFTGYVAHLIGDAMTLEGVAFLYPLSNKRLKGFFKTGGVTEFIVFLVLLGLNGLVLVKWF